MEQIFSREQLQRRRPGGGERFHAKAQQLVLLMIEPSVPNGAGSVIGFPHRMRVKPLATAGAASLQLLSGEDLLRQAKTFGVPLKPELAFEIAEYLDTNRSFAMTYNR